MAQDISNKINEATNDVILQGKDIRNRIVSSENDIKHHINDAEMCILEAIEGLGESIGNMEFDGNCNCDLSNYYNMNEIDAMFAELREGDNSEDEEETFLDAVLERDVVADITIGGINEKDTIPAGTTFTQFVEMLFTVIKAGTVSNPTMSGYANISKPTIKVSILGQDGKYSPINSGTIIKENSKLQIEIEIPTSETKNTDAKIVKTTTVLAQGYIRKKDDTVDIPNGSGDCEIGTKVISEGNDYVDIVSKSGCFSSFVITDGTTKITANLSNVNSDGSLQVKSVSKTYKVLSDSNYVVYAKSNKEETLEEIESKPNRVKTINKDSQIGGNLSYTEKSDVFSIKIETWGILPELKSEGNVSINAPLIEVKKTNGTIVNSGEKLSPDDEITVTVKLNGNSTVENQSAYLQKTSNTFQYGWEKLKDGVQTELVKTPSNNQKCTIGCKLACAVDTLLFSGTPSGVFENMKIDTVKNTISFGPITVDSNLSNNSFSVQAKSGTHKILSDANYQITALSNIYSTDENNSKTNRLIIAKDEELKKFNSRSSAISSFSFNLKDEVWIVMPNIVRTGGVVSFGNPSISVTKTDGTPVSNNAVLDPSDKLNITITLPQSSISDASYSANVSNLTYGWKLLQNGVETTGGPTDACNIDLTIDKTNAADKHTVTGTGAFYGLSTTTLTKNGVSVGESGKNYSLTITSTHGTYKIMPKYSDCKIYSISSFGKTNSNDSKYYKIPPTDTINGTPKSVTFKYSVKVVENIPYLLYKRYNLDNEAEAEEAINIMGISSISLEELIENYNYTKVISGETIGGPGYYIIFSDYNVVVEDPVTYANIVDKDPWYKTQIGGKSAICGEFVSTVKYNCKIS